MQLEMYGIHAMDCLHDLVHLKEMMLCRVFSLTDLSTLGFEQACGSGKTISQSRC